MSAHVLTVMPLSWRKAIRRFFVDALLLQPREGRCYYCHHVLTDDERHYYGRTCEGCEGWLEAKHQARMAKDYPPGYRAHHHEQDHTAAMQAWSNGEMHRAGFKDPAIYLRDERPDPYVAWVGALEEQKRAKEQQRPTHVKVCCGEYATCHEQCVPRDRWREQQGLWPHDGSASGEAFKAQMKLQDEQNAWARAEMAKNMRARQQLEAMAMAPSITLARVPAGTVVTNDLIADAMRQHGILAGEWDPGTCVRCGQWVQDLPCPSCGLITASPESMGFSPPKPAPVPHVEWLEEDPGEDEAQPGVPVREQMQQEPLHRGWPPGMLPASTPLCETSAPAALDQYLPHAPLADLDPESKLAMDRMQHSLEAIAASGMGYDFGSGDSTVVIEQRVDEKGDIHFRHVPESEWSAYTGWREPGSPTLAEVDAAVARLSEVTDQQAIDRINIDGARAREARRTQLGAEPWDHAAGDAS